MPHQCVKCGAIHTDSSSVIIHGCTDCKSKIFFFVRKEQMELANKRLKFLTKQDKENIEKDVFELVGDDYDHDAPVILDFECIRINGPGRYELDLVKLMSKGSPMVYCLEEGKYVVDLPESFERLKKK